MTWFLSLRIPPKVDGQPGLKSNRSFIAVGTPWSGPRVASDATAASAARALSMAWSKSVNTKAFRLGFRCSMRRIVAVISSTGESSRRRMRAASSPAEVQELSSLCAMGLNFDDLTASCTPTRPSPVEPADDLDCRDGRQPQHNAEEEDRHDEIARADQSGGGVHRVVVRRPDDRNRRNDKAQSA